MMSSIFSKLGVLLSPRSPPSPPSPQINTSALRRIYKEWNDFQADPPATCTAEPSDDMFKWRAEITPRSNSPDDDAETFVLDIEFPQHYPLLPPKVTLLNTNIDHPNIDSQGRLHVNSKMLDNWYPQFTISEALSSISSELTNAKIFAKIYGHLDIKIDGDLHISPYQYESGYFPVQIDRRIDVMLNDVPRKLHFIRNIYVAERWKHCADSIKYIVKQLFTLRIGQTYSYAWSPRFHQVLFEAGESNCRFYVDCGHELLEVEYEQVVYTVKLPYCSSDCGCFKSHERDCGRKIRCQIAETLEHVHNGRVEENNQTWRIRDKHNGNEIVSIDSSKPADIEKLYDNGERKLLLSLQDTQDEVKSDDSQPVESGANADDNKNEEENKKQNEHGLFSVKVDDKVQQPANNQFGGGGLPPAPSQDSSSKDAYWECQSCTFVNSVASPACKICSNPQPKSANNSNAQQSNNKKKPNNPPPPPQVKKQRRNADDNKNEEENKKQNEHGLSSVKVDDKVQLKVKLDKVRFYALSYLIVVCSFGVAMITDNIGAIFGLIGSTATIIIAFILPGLFYFYFVFQEQNDGKKSADNIHGQNANANADIRRQKKENVRRWLRDTVELPEYIDIFLSNGYDDLITIVETIEEGDLLDIGINKRGHRKKIMLLINKQKRIASRQ